MITKKRLFASFLGLALLTHPWNPLVATAEIVEPSILEFIHPESLAPDNSDKESWLDRVNTAHLTRAGLFVIGGLTITATDPDKFLKQCTPKNLAQSAATEYVRAFFINACHEGGHAVTARLLTESQPTVYLGSGTAREGLTVLPGLVINGLHSTRGLTENISTIAAGKKELLMEKIKTIIADSLLTKQKKKAQLQELLKNFDPHVSRAAIASIILAGPLCGLAANFSVKILAGENPFIPDTRDMWQLCNLIVRHQSDGENLAKNVCGMSDKTASQCDSFGIPLMFAMLLGTSAARAALSSEGLSTHSFFDAFGYDCLNAATHGCIAFNSQAGG